MYMTTTLLTCGEAVGHRTPFLLVRTLFDELLLVNFQTALTTTSN